MKLKIRTRADDTANISVVFFNSIHFISDFLQSAEESQPQDAMEEEDPPVHIGLPKGNIGQQLIYILSFPALFLLYVTLPDVNNKHYTIFPSLRIPGNSNT